MAFRRHNPQWIGVYRGDSGNYIRNGEPVVVGGSSGYNSLIGFNSTAILDDVNTSKVQPRIHLRMNVTDAGTFDYGVHKSTTNKATNGIPFYRWTGRSFFPNTGSRSYDITDYGITVDGEDNLIDSMKNDGYHGIVLYGGPGGAYGVADGLYIEIEGTWNEPPTAPALTYPIGGETLSGEVTFSADAATDPENDTLTYQFRLKDGETTHYFARDGLTQTVDLSGYAESSTAEVGVRAYDGQAYGPWDVSGAFTIRHNIPPSQPTLKEPVGGVSRDRTKTIRFLWEHNDDDPQSLFRFQWRVQGTTTWNSLETVTTDELVAIPGNTFPAGNIEWQIQTEDQGGLVSPWSSSGLFLSTEKSDAPTITKPAEAEVIPSETLNVTWSSSGQVQYEVEVLDGTTTHWSVQRTSGNKGVTVAAPLENNTSYTVRVRISDSGGLWSEWAGVNITTSFTPPTQAELSTQANELQAAIYIDIDNPLPSGTQPTAESNDLYRRKRGGAWERIAKDLTPNTGYMDYTPAGNVVYEYRAVTQGDNATTMDSVAVIGSVNVNKVRLNVAFNPSIYVELRFEPNRSFNFSVDAHFQGYSGRNKLVAEIGEIEESDISVNYMIHEDDYESLLSMIKGKTTLLYRDHKGRKMFVVATSLNLTDQKRIFQDYYSIQLPLMEVDYKEEV